MKRVTTRMATAAALGVLLAGVGSVPLAAAASAAPDCTTREAVLQPVNYTIKHLDGTTQYSKTVSNTDPANVAAGVRVRGGDVITGSFRVNPLCPAWVQLSGASYYAPSAVFSDDNQKQQVLFHKTTTWAKPGSTVKLTLRLPVGSPAGSGTACPNPHNTGAQAYNGNGGPAPANPYASTCDGRPSLNGSGAGAATGQPCQGCVGNADNKNPAGQAPNGTDANAGYECDRNRGVGQGNPAHTSCVRMPNFQMEFVVGRVIEKFVVNGVYTPYNQNRVIWGGSALG